MSRARALCAALCVGCLALGGVSGVPTVVDQTDPDAAFILTNATVAGILAVAGTPRKQVRRARSAVDRCRSSASIQPPPPARR